MYMFERVHAFPISFAAIMEDLFIVEPNSLLYLLNVLIKINFNVTTKCTDGVIKSNFTQEK